MGERLDRDIRDVRVIEKDPASVRSQQTDQVLRQRGLARPVRSDECNGLAGRDLERDVADRFRTARVCEGDGLDNDGWTPARLGGRPG